MPECSNESNLEISSQGKIMVLSRNLLGGIEENKQTNLGYVLSWPRFASEPLEYKS
jgi:hypothetical protein